MVRERAYQGWSAMTITLNLQPDVERDLAAQARVRGLSLPDYLEQIVARAVSADSRTSSSPSSQGNLHQFFMNSPLRGADLDLERASDYPRPFDFE